MFTGNSIHNFGKTATIKQCELEGNMYAKAKNVKRHS